MSIYERYNGAKVLWLSKYVPEYMSVLQTLEMRFQAAQSYFFILNIKLLHVVLDGRSSEDDHTKPAVPKSSIFFSVNSSIIDIGKVIRKIIKVH